MPKYLGANQNIGGKMVSMTDEYMDVSQLLGARVRDLPKSTSMQDDTVTLGACR